MEHTNLVDMNNTHVLFTLLLMPIRNSGANGAINGTGILVTQLLCHSINILLHYQGLASGWNVIGR